MRWSMLLMGLWVLSPCWGQMNDTTFNVTIENNSHSSATSIIKTDIGYLSIGFGNVNGWNGLKTVALDPYGNVLKINGYHEPDHLYLAGWSSLFQYSDSSYLIPLFREDSNGVSIAAIWELNAFGDTVNSFDYQYKDGAILYQGNRFISMDTLSDGNYLVTGYVSRYPFTTPGLYQSDFWLLKLDSSLNVVWSKHFGSNAIEASSNAAELNNGDLLLGGSRYDSGLGYNDPVIYRLTSSGGVRWMKNLGTSGSDSEALVSAASDGGYYAVYLLDTILGTSNQTNPLIINKYDSLDSLEWSYSVSGSHYIEITKVFESDSSLIILGAYSNTAIDFYNGTIWKLDLIGQNLEVFSYNPQIPDAVFGGSSIYDVCFTGNNGFLACGTTGDFTPPPSEDFWFIKADSNGCIAVDSNCITDTTAMDDIIITDNVLVYPNPASNHLFVNASGPLVEFRLFSLLGAELLRQLVNGQESVDVSALPGGLYVYELRAGGHVRVGKVVVQ